MPLPPGDVSIAFAFSKTAQLAGDVRLYAGETLIGQGHLARTLIRPLLAPLRIGATSKPPVSPMTRGLQGFKGRIRRVLFSIGG